MQPGKVADNNPDIVKELNLLADEARLDLGDKLTDVESWNIRPPDRIEESRLISYENPNDTNHHRLRWFLCKVESSPSSFYPQYRGLLLPHHAAAQYHLAN